MNPSLDHQAFIVTGPTSGFGRATALRLAEHGTVVLVGRDAGKLDDVRRAVERRGGRAVPVVCDLSDLRSVRRAAAEIVALGLPVAGLLNNAGIFQMRATRNAQGWDTAFVTNHVGPFVLTEALLPHLADGVNVVFVASGVEDPERKPAKAAGFRGGRYLSAGASARGEWIPGGAAMPGADAYATSKQCTLAAAMELARENPRLNINAVEPGFSPGTALGRDANVVLRVVLMPVLSLLAPFVKYWSTPKRAARVIAGIMLDRSRRSGVYYDDGGQPMQASAQVRDPRFTSRVVAETRALLATLPKPDETAQSA